MAEMAKPGKPFPPPRTPATPTAPAAASTPPATPAAAPSVPRRRTATPATSTGNLSAKVKSHVSQTPQTVGTNPNAPDTRQASARVDTAVPYASGYTPYLGY